MAKLTRKTARVFGEAAVATGDDPQIGQFGSGKKGTYEGTGDIDLIQSLDDGLQWSHGWIDAVTPTQQFPTLPEMTGVHKVLSYQSAYILQEGIAEYDANTTYYTNSLCKALDTNNNLVIYKSKVDENTGNAVSNTTYWEPLYGFAANQQLSNLAPEGENRLHALKSYEDAGEILTDEEGLIDVTNYAHSTFDASKVGTTGTPIIKNGSLNIISGTVLNFSSSNYLTLPSFTISGAWKATYKFNLASLTADVPLLAGGQNRIDINTNGKVDITASGSYISLLNNGAITTGTNYLLIVSYDGSSTYSAFLINLSNNTMVNDDGTLSSTMTNVSRTWYIGSDTSATKYLNGSFTLSGFSLITGASSVNASQTGTDTYTISGNTVSIPYTLSKTGSKVVDSAYRTQVASVYSALGYSPYYTINEGINFTLPQGELYGMYENFREKAEYNIMPDYDNAIEITSPSLTDGYTAPSDGYLFLGLFVSSSGTNNRIINVNNVHCLYIHTGDGATTPILLNKGDVVSIDANPSQVAVNQLTFVPLKGV